MDPINRVNGPRQGTQEAALDRNKVLEVCAVRTGSHGACCRPSAHQSAVITFYHQLPPHHMMHAHHIPSSLKSLCVGWGKVLGPVGVRYEGTVEALPAPHPASVDISLWHPLAATGASPWVKPGSFGARTCSGLGLGHVGRHVLMYTSELCPSVAPPPPMPSPSAPGTKVFPGSSPRRGRAEMPHSTKGN